MGNVSLSHPLSVLVPDAGLWSTIFVLVAAAFVMLVFRHRDGRAFGTRARPDLHTVPGVPLLGNLLGALTRGDRQMETWTAWRTGNKDKSKPLSVTLPGLRFIDVAKPSWIEYIQKTNFANYRKGPRLHEVMLDVLGDGIFAVDGEKWLMQRKATSKIFTSGNFRTFITDAIQKELKALNALLSQFADSGKPFDLSDVFFRFTLESFGLMAFGANLGALTSESPVPFAAAFDYAQEGVARRLNNPLWKLTQYFTGEKRKMNEATKIMDDFAFKIIAQREMEGLGNITRKDMKDVTDLLSVYMALRDDNGKPLSRRALRDSVMNLLIAGRDTTAQALSWTFFHLLSHRELVVPLRVEADEIVTVDYASYRKMTQIQAAFHENAWEAIGDDQIPDGGPFVEAGNLVVWGDWEMGRFSSVWGSDAADFKPSRWIDEYQELKKESQFKFHAFNGGPRLCLGQTLAIYEATAVMAAIVRDFDLAFAPGYLENVEMVDCEQTPRYRNSLTLPMAAPLLVTAMHRKADLVDGAAKS